MKKFLLTLIAVAFLLVGTAYALDSGNIITHSGAVWEPGKTYRLVRVLPGNMYSGATLYDPVYEEVSAGYVMVWATGTSGADGVTVQPCSLLSYDSRVAGVMASSTLISYESGKNYTYASDDYTSANWGYLQTHGKAYTRVSSLVSVGDLVGCAYYITGTAAMYNTNFTDGTKNTTGAEHDPQRQGVLGFCLEADTSTTTAGDDNFVNVFVTLE